MNSLKDSTPSSGASTRDTFHTVADVVRQVRSLLQASMDGLEQLGKSIEASELQQMTLRSLVTARARAAEALTEPGGSPAGTVEKTWTQYAVVFQSADALRQEVATAGDVHVAATRLGQLDNELIAALSGLSSGAPQIADFAEAVCSLLRHVERQSALALNAELDM